MKHVFLVILKDRHTDDEITAHESRAGADAVFDAHKQVYDEEEKRRGRPARVWIESDKPDGHTVRSARCDGEGPEILVEHIEVDP